MPSIVIVFKQIQYHGIVDFCRRIPSCYQRGWITELSISSQAPHQTFALSSGFISLVYCWGLLRRFYLLSCGQYNFWSSLHLDLLWRDIILLEPNAVLENFITNLPANREFGALKNFREQQGLNFLIVHDITSAVTSCLVIITICVHLPCNILFRGAADTIIMAFLFISKVDVTCFNPAGFSTLVFNIIGSPLRVQECNFSSA